MSKVIQISPVLYNLLNDFTNKLHEATEIATEIKKQAAVEGLSNNDTRELVASFSKNKSLNVTPKYDDKQVTIDCYSVELYSKDDVQVESKAIERTEEPTSQVLPSMPVGTKPALAERTDVLSVAFRPYDFAGVLAQAIRDDRKVLLRIKNDAVLGVDLII